MSEPTFSSSGRIPVSCPGCFEKYFVETARISSEGGKLTCRMCGARIPLPRREAVVAPLLDPSGPSAAQGEGGPLPELSFDESELGGSEASGIDGDNVPAYPPSATHTQPQPIVLIVEDSEFFLRLAQDSLAGQFRTLCARSASEGIAALRQGPVDLLVLDLTLEGDDDGLDVLSEAATRALPCLIFTARSEAELWGKGWERLRDLGASDLLCKGMNIEEQLLDKVSALLAAVPA